MMESACLRHTEIPHTSALFSDFQYHFDKVARFYAHNPHDSRSYAAAAREIAYPDDRRAALVAALRASNSETASLDLLARPGTVAVVTGQQVGLFSGPAYTIYKALTAVRLAAQLSEQGIPAVPMFWLATEDHDVAEVNHAFVFGPDHRPIQLSVDCERRIRAPSGRDSDRRAAGGWPARGAGWFSARRRSGGDGARRLSGRCNFWQRLSARCWSGCWRGGACCSSIRWMNPYGAWLRRLLQETVRQDEALHAKLIERGQQLESAGYHAQVHVEAKTSLVFLLDRERRATLRRQNGEYASERTKIFRERADRSRGTIVTQCVVAARGAGLRAAYRCLRRRARGISVHGAIAGAVSRTAGPDAGDGVARRIHAAGRAHR